MDHYFRYSCLAYRGEMISHPENWLKIIPRINNEANVRKCNEPQAVCMARSYLSSIFPYTSVYAGKFFQQHFEKILSKFKSVLSVNLKKQNSTVVKNELRNHSNFMYKIQSLKLVSITECRVTEAQLAPVLSKTGYNLHGKLNSQSVVMASYKCTQLWLRDTSSRWVSQGSFPRCTVQRVILKAQSPGPISPEILTEGVRGNRSALLKYSRYFEKYCPKEVHVCMYHNTC